MLVTYDTSFDIMASFPLRAITYLFTARTILIIWTFQVLVDCYGDVRDTAYSRYIQPNFIAGMTAHVLAIIHHIVALYCDES